MPSVLAIFSMFVFASSIIKAEVYNDVDLIALGDEVVDHLNFWCADAWCAGDFQHTFFSLVYQSDKGRWLLDFQTFPHNEIDSVSEPIETNFMAKPFVVMHSVCAFPSINPLEMIEFSEIRADFARISSTMSELLMECVGKSEQRARAFFGV